MKKLLKNANKSNFRGVNRTKLCLFSFSDRLRILLSKALLTSLQETCKWFAKQNRQHCDMSTGVWDWCGLIFILILADNDLRKCDFFFANIQCENDCLGALTINLCHPIKIKYYFYVNYYYLKPLKVKMLPYLFLN